MPRVPHAPVRLRRAVVTAVTSSLLLTSCSAADGPTPRASPRAEQTSPTVATGPAATSPPARPCPTVQPTPPTGPSAEAVTADRPSSDLRVDVVRYPRPRTPGAPWSHWGQGMVTPDGRFFSAIGNHLGEDGNSFLFVYDPESSRLTRFSDVRSQVEGNPSWGYGKIHGQIVAIDCEQAVFSTYWGSRDGLRYTASYQGDQMFRLDTTTLDLEPLGTAVSERGVPSLAGHAGTGLIFGEGVDPGARSDDPGPRGTFFVYDTTDREVVFESDNPRHSGFRNVLVDAEGTAYIAGQDGELLTYRRGTNELGTHPGRLPGGGALRASTHPTDKGTVYGVTSKPYELFALTADGTISGVGAALGYTTSMAVEPDGSRFYYVPGAHGSQPELGTPLVSVDPDTGEQSTIVRLDDVVSQAAGLHTSGTYSVVLDSTTRRLFVMLNAGPAPDDRWGEVVLAVVHLPSPSDSDHDVATSVTETPDTSVATQCLPGRSLRTVYDAPTMGRPGALAFDDATGTWQAWDPLIGMYGHAVATADVNGDGWTDLFVGTFADRPDENYRVRGASGPSPDRLLLGGPNGFVVDTAFRLRPGRTSGAAFADLDADGDPDLVVARNVRDSARGRSPTTVLRNDDGRFREVATLDQPRGARSVGLLDYDGDDRLDLFVAEDRFSGGSSVLLRNLGGFDFTDVTRQAGLPLDLHGLGVGTGDLDGDGTPDLVVGGSNRVFLNSAAGRFVEQRDAIAPWPTFGDEDDPAGVALGDVNSDGRLDVLLGQHYNSTVDDGRRVPARLYLNTEASDGGIRLRDVTEAAGLPALPTKSPHVQIADLDNDGRPDIVTTAVGSDGPPVVLRQVGERAGVPRFEASAPSTAQYSVTGAVVDIDRDGRQDLVAVAWEPERPTTLWRNTAPAGHWVAVAAPPATVVEVRPERARPERDQDVLARAEVATSTGYAAGPSGHVWIGLGDVDRIEVSLTDPGERPITHSGLAADRLVVCQ